MSSRRLALLALGLPLLTGACGAPVVSAVGYGADGVSLAESGKSTGDHFISMVSRKDCAVWRAFRGRDICTERKDGRDPYHVDYDQPTRLPSEDGVAYAPPLHAAPDAPATSWTADAYKPAASSPAQAAAPAPAAEPAQALADPTPSAPASAAKPGKPVRKKAKVHAHAKAPVKKPSPGQVASVP